MEIEKIIDKLSWTEAKTMKNIPHEYTVRDKSLEEEYKTLYFHIKKNYYIGFFYRKPFKYCDIGEYTYWYMSEDLNDSRIINRCRKKE